MPRIERSEKGIQRWLEEAENHERSGTFRSIRLDRIGAFLARLPAPPRPLTVAGTKGKGSTVRLAEAALRAHGIPTLAFTSPHVASVLERWRIDGMVATAEQLAGACDEVAAHPGADALTYFERTFAVAVMIAASKPDCAFLCEVGLGGRLDCANALDCAVAVLAHLSHDHREVLGPTLRHIAREKLAICRPDAPLIVAPQSPEAMAAIRAELPRGVAATVIQRSSTTYALALPGAHQQDNAATAWAAVQRLRPGLDEATARGGMAAAQLAARCQLVEDRGRRILVDGAHNGPSVAATLVVAAQALRPPWRLVIGLAREKELDEILAAIPPGLAVTRCAYGSARARGRGDWDGRAQDWPWRESIAAVLAEADERDLCVTGSLYLAGEALAALGLAGLTPG
jgi:dihydrofolate synthase/folylpolyglutamate synthase